MPRRLSVLLVEGLSDPIPLSVARCLTDIPGVQVHTLAVDQHSSLRFSRHRSSFQLQPPGLAPAQALEHLEKVMKATRADVLMPVMEPAVEFVAAHQAAIRPWAVIAPNPDLQTFKLVNNKWLLARFLEERGLPCPPTVRYSPDDAFYKRLASLSFPVLLKPATARGGRDIRRFDTLAQLRAFCETAGPFSEPFIVQSFIEGYDIDCSVICRDGRILAYTQQKGLIANRTPFGPSQGIELVHSRPLLEVMERLMAALGWSGVAHVDLRYSAADGEIKIIEVNPRYWNTMIGSQVAGVNFPYLAGLAALGETFPCPEYTDLRYVPVSVAFGQALRALQGKEHLSLTLDETNVRYLVSDPLPLLMRGLARLGRRGSATPASTDSEPSIA
jgi:predicted ATP-grasp superfamily ATP-dependent carboligase